MIKGRYKEIYISISPKVSLWVSGITSRATESYFTSFLSVAVHFNIQNYMCIKIWWIKDYYLFCQFFHFTAITTGNTQNKVYARKNVKVKLRIIPPSENLPKTDRWFIGHNTSTLHILFLPFYNYLPHVKLRVYSLNNQETSNLINGCLVIW